ncbi:MAG: hypothetical protein ABJ000_18230 [Saccharospirillum sp.]|uniref:hypothetical protein n=1 Tax=Saccharospirillum sp. TaxID=2033801 RepID=UPI00329A6FE8
MFDKKVGMALLLSLALVACDGDGYGSDDGDGDTGGGTGGETGGDTGGSTTTDEGVEIVLGSGSGGSFDAGVLTLATASIGAEGQTAVTVNIVDSNDNDALYNGAPVTVEFTSACLQDGKATFSSSSVVTGTGSATTTYLPEGCVGDDVILASIGDARATATVNVSPADVGFVAYSGTDVTSIAYNTYWGGSQPSIATVTFTLFDDRGKPVSGQTVTFALTSEDGETTLSNNTAESNEAGIVTTRVKAGSIAISVRVIATFTADDGREISTVSYPIAVNSGPAEIDSFSLAADLFAPEAWNRDGEEINFTVTAGDHHNNPVPDGTEISFWTEFGLISDTCTTTEGRCSVTWTSGGDRSTSPLPADGLATITAWTAGEDSFYETGAANQLFDPGESFLSTPERFYDRNKNGTYDAAFESYYDYNEDGTYNASSPLFRGYSCSEAAKTAGHCADSVEVWDDIQILMAGSAINITPTPGSATGEQTFNIFLEDVNGNQPPAGSSVSVQTSYGTATIIGESDVPDGVSTTGYTVVILFEPDTDPGNGNMIVEVETPSGVKSAIVIPVSN